MVHVQDEEQLQRPHLDRVDLIRLRRHAEHHHLRPRMQMLSVVVSSHHSLPSDSKVAHHEVLHVAQMVSGVPVSGKHRHKAGKHLSMCKIADIGKLSCMFVASPSRQSGMVCLKFVDRMLT